MNSRTLSILGLLICIVLFVAVNLLAGSSLRSARLDLTQNHLYTLTAGTRRITAAVPDQVTLTLYYTPAATAGLPAYKAYAARVQEMLEEYSRLSGGKIVVRVVNPEPFSEAEDEAVAAGVAGVQAGRERLYLGIVGRNTGKAEQVLPFLDPDKEQFLEYDLTRMVYLLSNPQKKTVGVLSSLPLEGSRFDPMTGQQGNDPPWQILVQLKQMFGVKMIDAAKPGDIKGLDALVIIHPKALSDEMLYAIDQYVLAGGRTLILVDPNCESEAIRGMDLQARMRQDKSSNLKRLFGAWGMEMAEGKVAGDLDAAMKSTSANPNRPEQVDYVVWLHLVDSNLNRDDAVTGMLHNMVLATAGILSKTEGTTANPNLTLTPLIETGTRSMAIDQARVQFIPEPARLLADFQPSGKKLILAARLGGKVKTAFPDGSPVKAPAAGEAPQPASLTESAGPINAIVVADVDMAADNLWVREDRLGGISLGFTKLSDNGDFILSAVDNLTGSSDLISVRARGQYSRPFTKVEAIQKDAAQKYQAEQQRLEEEIRSAERKITELQQQRPAAGPDGLVILSPEQRAEINRLQEKALASRKQKRQVEHDMRKDIERLGTTLSIVNTAAVPAAVCLVALGIGAFRASRRRADRIRGTGLRTGV
ncbi:MAG: GldG family protein [Phycisphaerales bacterium]|nr:GldG family protein [Phycisphaerales bacterium]